MNGTNGTTPRRTTPKKTDAEKGPLGAWARGARIVLGISTLDAAAAAGISDATLRKIEGGSYKNPARRVVWELWQFYAAAARDQHVPIPDPPAEWQEPVRMPDLVTPDPLAALTAAMTAQTEAITALLRELDTERRARADVADRIAALEAQVRGLLAVVHPLQQGSAGQGARLAPPENGE